MENNYFEPDTEFKKENRRRQRQIIIKEILLFIAYVGCISLFTAGIRRIAEWFFSR